MNKLTLSIPGKLIIDAKNYSKETNQSLSALVTKYFLLLSAGIKGGKKSKNISARLAKVTGLVGSNKDEEDLLLEELLKKYQ